MRNKRFTFPLATFAGGLVMGILLISIYSFKSEVPSAVPTPGNSKISVKDANDMFKRYYSTATSTNARFKGFAINRDEFQAIKTLFSQNDSLDACRVYLGKDKSNKDVRIVVGVNDRGGDMTSGGIYKTPASHSSPCPTICDQASPITIH